MVDGGAAAVGGGVVVDGGAVAVDGMLPLGVVVEVGGVAVPGFIWPGVVLTVLPPTPLATNPPAATPGTTATPPLAPGVA